MHQVMLRYGLMTKIGWLPPAGALWANGIGVPPLAYTPMFCAWAKMRVALGVAWVAAAVVAGRPCMCAGRLDGVSVTLSLPAC